jgi:hypothetical protein
MPTIEVDFDVYKAITLRRPTEEVSENDILRELLKLPTHKASPPAANAAPGDWFSKGVRFPSGTEFRATYKGQAYLARIENGSLILNGKKHNSLSAAAVSITGSAVNGWNFWECRVPGGAWKSINTLRK